MIQDLDKEFSFQFSRSGGPGGQNVNKVATKAELRFHVDSSKILSEEEKNMLKEKLANQLTADGHLVVVSQSERSQFANKEETIRKFYEMVRRAFTKPKARKKTKPSFSAVRKRLEGKRKQAEKKSLRGPVSRPD
jgi:ribosome-associated protein